ncbi:LAETG motif-containing sortase-dependent surface protein [Kitasatospora sp. NPDC047058]|uniref:LAETG motif-containing sortase-dependent surface protein n=1 Tax=Kitasatospora sp. NPDC047058 TaxID=3155620 RepID=UPI00340F0707
MKIRRALAAAVVAAAVLSPAALSVTPAFAETGAGQGRVDGIAKLEKAAADAAKAYEAAVAEEAAKQKETTDKLHGPLPAEIGERVAKADAAKSAAVRKRDAAVKARQDASAAIDKLPPTATDDERVALFVALHQRDVELDAAKAGLAAAEQESAAAKDAADDWRVAVSRELGKAQQALKVAKEAKEAADKALADLRAAAAALPAPKPAEGTGSGTPAEQAQTVPAGTTTAQNASAVPAGSGTTTARTSGSTGRSTGSTGTTTTTTTTTAGTTTTAAGELADTGASDATSQLALMSAVSMAAGVGVLFYVRRRKAGSAA